VRPTFDARTAVAHLRRTDPALARLIERVGPFRLQLDPTPSLFHALSRAIVYQQLNGKAAATIFGRVCALFPRAGGEPQPVHILRASDAKLRGAGLSGSKLLSLRDLARRVESGEVPSFDEVERMDDAEIVERLTAVRGIGRWTAEMLLIFNLGRPDVLPADDYGIRQGLKLALRRRELPSRKQVLARGERWQPYRTAASWYLWRAVDLAKQ
jgi:3-methyladenine DNA glycosylase/8-oxoguanine DNA glycosylase